MQENITRLRHLMDDLFEDIVHLEQQTLKKGPLGYLSMSEVHTIEAIGQNQARSMSEVAQSLKVTDSTVTAAIKKLVDKGLVRRKSIKSDRRVVQVELTKEGVLAYRLHDRFHVQMARTVLKDIQEDQQEVMMEAMERLSLFLKHNLQTESEGEA